MTVRHEHTTEHAVSEDRLREAGDSDEVVEDEIAESFDSTVTEGAERLQRPWRVVLITGFFGGLEVGLGVAAYLAVLHQTGDHLLAGVAFSVGLIALLLAHSELSTENFLMPIAALVAREGTVGQLARLWGGTLLANLAGGWLFMLLLTTAFPQWHDTLEEAARHYVDAPFGVQSIVLALLGVAPSR
jgi:formate/nitrite transporter FocA (FNT family)